MPNTHCILCEHHLTLILPFAIFPLRAARAIHVITAPYQSTRDRGRWDTPTGGTTPFRLARSPTARRPFLPFVHDVPVCFGEQHTPPETTDKVPVASHRASSHCTRRGTPASTAHGPRPGEKDRDGRGGPISVRVPYSYDNEVPRYSPCFPVTRGYRLGMRMVPSSLPTSPPLPLRVRILGSPKLARCAPLTGRACMHCG